MILTWQLDLSRFDIGLYRLKGEEVAIAYDLSRIEGYTSRVATEEEFTTANFVAKAIPRCQVTARRQTNVHRETPANANRCWNQPRRDQHV